VAQISDGSKPSIELNVLAMKSSQEAAAGAPTLPSPQLFIKHAGGRVATASAFARGELETFALALREIVVPETVQVRVWPYRHDGLTYWSFDVDGCADGVSLTFVENGHTRLPHEALYDGTGSVADAVDAHYLFAFLERELSGDSAGF
jgi:hypothetical protein